jgi:hypothetical protein
MPAPQSGQTKLRIAEIKFMLVFLTTVTEAIMPLLFLRRFFTAEAQKPKRGAAGAFLGRARSRQGLAAPRFGFNCKSNCVTKCFARKVSASYNVYPVSMKEIG